MESESPACEAWLPQGLAFVSWASSSLVSSLRVRYMVPPELLSSVRVSSELLTPPRQHLPTFSPGSLSPATQ